MKCLKCGHAKVFHQIGTGNGVPVGQAFCDDRHDKPCSCQGFIPIKEIKLMYKLMLMSVDGRELGWSETHPQTFASLTEAIAYLSRINQNDHYQIKTYIPSLKSVLDPPYYQELKPEPVEVYEAWGLPPHLCNVVKYIARAGKKPGVDTLEDLEKARRYLVRQINLVKGTPGW